MSKFTEKRDELEAKAKPFLMAWLTGVKDSPGQHGLTLILGGVIALVLRFFLR